MDNLTVEALLQSLPKGEKIYYRSNPGNAGDALIAAGTFHLFDKLNLNFDFVDPDNFDSTGKIVIYAGGGNFNHIYPEAREFMSKHHKRAKMLILLPHTITENEDLLAEFGSNVVLFAREKVSYEHIINNAKACNTYMDHDMAFHLDIEKILRENNQKTIALVIKKGISIIFGKANRSKIPTLGKLLETFAFELKTNLQNRKIGNFFRTDVESSGRPVPKHNADLSKIYEYSTRNRELIDHTVYKLVSYLSGFEIVNTDRLHICIAAGISGKKVNFYGNSYFKCKAVYENSIQKKLNNVKWMDS